MTLLILQVGMEKWFTRELFLGTWGSPLEFAQLLTRYLNGYWIGIKKWGYVLLSFHNRIKILNAYMIPLISFNSPVLKMAKVHWKEFLKPIKKFLWKNSSRLSTPWH